MKKLTLKELEQIKGGTKVQIDTDLKKDRKVDIPGNDLEEFLTI